MSIHVEGLPVRDELEALRLMVHHLELAAQLFEATPENVRAFLSAPGGHFSTPAILAWAEAMEALYPAGDGYVPGEEDIRIGGTD